MVLERLRVLTWIFVLLFAAVDVRLAHLQFLERDFWAAEAEAIQRDGEGVSFRRGAIVDRDGKPLAVGEIEQTLNLLQSEFRRQTALGQVIAGTRLLVTQCGRVDLEVPRLDQVVQQPERSVRAVFSMTGAALATHPKRVREDYGFYVRSLLGLSESEFRTVRERTAADVPMNRLVPDAVEIATARVNDQAKALGELAKAIGVERAELLLRIEQKSRELEALIAEASEAAEAARSGAGSIDAKQLVALRRDYENRLQLLERGIPYAAVFLVNMAPERFRGIEIHDVDSRTYPEKYATVSPLLIGWVGSATPEVCAVTRQHELRLRQLESQDPRAIDDDMALEIERLRNAVRYEDYLPDEQLGRDGLEAVLEPALRGRRGWKLVERDRSRIDQELLDQQPSFDGHDVALTLDADLQLAVQRVLDRFHHQGAIVLLDPADGAIRAMGSWPNPSREKLADDYGKLAEDKLNPLFQRCYRFRMNPPPPGSVFKLIVATAGLESGALGEFTTAECGKTYESFGKTLHCLGLHGQIDLKTALAKSCNIYFYRTALGVGYDRIIDMARRFGLGEPSGFGDPEKLGLVGEAKEIGEMAFMPPSSSSSKHFTLQTAIGHGAVDDITPLQVATLVAPFANGGDRVTPYLVDRIGDAAAKRTPPKKIGLKASTLDVIRRSMAMVCEQGGTAGPTAGGKEDLRPWRVAGKTGSPEAEKTLDHAWFTGFFPFERPRLVFAVFAEEVHGHGGETCRPLLFDLLQQPELERYR